MIGRDPKLTVSPIDDEFHTPSCDESNWIETMWFPCWIPERNMSISVRLWFAANLKLQGGAVSAWTDDGKILFGDKWTDEMPSPIDLTNVRTSHGVNITRQNPLNTFCISYEAKDISLEFRFEAIMAPNPVSPEESPGMFEGHFEQAGRVAGELNLRGEKLGIDCYSVRDRSWGPRQMPDRLRLGNAYGANNEMAFFSYINPTPDGREVITGGYYIKDGQEATIIEGERITTWLDSSPTSVSIEAVDALKRKIILTGSCRNTMASNAGSGVYGILNLIEWDDGKQKFWGENHDIWSESQWLESGRPKI
jgi:hypothetical protein